MASADIESGAEGGALAGLRDRVREQLKAYLRTEGASNQFPLSFGQEALWFLHKLEPDSFAYNLPIVLPMPRRMSGSEVEDVLCAVASAHPMLRVRFEERSGRPVQMIDTRRRVPCLVRDVREETEEALLQRMQVSNRMPLDLEKGVTWRAELFERRAESPLLLITISHLVFDGVSVGPFLRDFLAALNGDGPACHSTVDYRTYVLEQRRWVESEAGQRARSYWLELLSGELPVLGLPIDASPTDRSTVSSGMLRFELPEAFCEQLREFARAKRITLFTLVLGAYHLVLRRYAGQEDIITGTPATGRVDSRFENTVGYFVNPVAIRSCPASDQPVETFLTALRDQVMKALSFQDYPFPLVVRDLGGARDVSRSPVFQAEFNFESWVEEGSKDVLDAFGLEPFGWLHQEGEFDLALDVFAAESKLSGAFRYRSDKYSLMSVERWRAALLTVLERIIEDAQQSVASVTRATAEDRDFYLTVSEKVTAAFPETATVDELFRKQVARFGDRPAVGDGEVWWTYQEVDRMANQIAGYLRDRDVGSGDRVGLLLHRTPRMVVGLLGVLRTGAAYVPMDPSFPRERLEMMAEDAGLSFIVTDSEIDFDRVRVPRLHWEHQKKEWEAFDAAASWDPVDSRSLAYLIYTSGSTGRPKGVCVSHRALVNFLVSMAREPGVSASDLLLAVTTLSFDIAALEMFLPLVVGGRVLIADEQATRDGRLLTALLREHRVSVMQATPATWKMLLISGWDGSPNLKVICGGEALPRELANRLLERAKEVWNVYGPTETTIWSAVARVDDENEPIVLGKPIANTQFVVVDSARQLVPVGTIGELWIGGEGVAEGYWNRQELTNERFVMASFFGPEERWYRTGDLVRYNGPQRLEFLGRGDAQVKIRGFRIELGDIESVLARDPGVGQVVVHPVEHERGEPTLVAYFTEKGGVVQEKALRRLVQDALPEYMHPAVYMRLDQIPLTPNRKVDRRALPSPSTQLTETSVSSHRDLGSVESWLKGHWAALLGHETFGFNDNFFEIGGHSLLANELVAKLVSRYPALAVVDVFTHPTVSLLSRHLESLAPIVESEKGDSFRDEEAVARKPSSLKDSIKSKEAQSVSDDAVAIVGMAGRFPGAASVEEFWERLLAGDELIEFYDAKTLHAVGVPSDKYEASNYVPAAGSVRGADEFDAAFFGYNGTQATWLDPQQRILLECAHEALEHAGCSQDYAGGNIGVYVGVGDNTYRPGHVRQMGDQMSPALASTAYTGNDKDFAATRVSYKLNLKGPSFSVQTACSTSLVAVHLARQSLLSGECDAALAGGSSILFPQTVGYQYQPKMVLSPDGHCRPFDADAAGTVFTNGTGIVVLKRLSDALREGDKIYAVLAGTAINNDGATKVDFMAPSVGGQSEVIARAMRAARVKPEKIGFVEAHGTGTALGDPIEVAGLLSAYRELGAAEGFRCALGSVKGNVGHLGAVAGVASLMKASLSLYSRSLPATLHWQRANPQIPLDGAPFFVNQDRLELLSDGEIAAGVSSFGIGGTNAHAVLKSPPNRVRDAVPSEVFWLPLSARSLEAARVVETELADYLESVDQSRELRDVAFTLQVGRKAWEHRRFLLVSSREEALQALREGGTFHEVSDGDLAIWCDWAGVNLMRLSVPEWTALCPSFGTTWEQLVELLPGGESGMEDPWILQYCIARCLLSVIESRGLIPEGHRCAPVVAWAVWASQHAVDDRAVLSALAKRSPLPIPELSPVEVSVLGGLDQALDPKTVVWESDSLIERRERQDESALARLPGRFIWLRMQSASVAAEAVSEDTSKAVCMAVESLRDHRALETNLARAWGELWLHGAVVDWKRYAETAGAQKVSLPSYPLKRQRYWFSDGASSSSVNNGKRLSTMDSDVAPLIAIREAGMSSHEASMTLSGSEFYLKDHVIGGEKILPGAVMIEGLFQSGRGRSLELSALEIDQLVFLKPVVVRDEPVRLILGYDGSSVGGGAHEVRWQSDQGQSEHSRGKLRVLEDGKKSPSEVDLLSVRERCKKEVSAGSIYAEMARFGTEYGSGLRSLSQFELGESELLVDFAVPHAVRDGFEEWCFHPAILDGAFQAIAVLVADECKQLELNYLPFSVRRLRIHRRIGVEGRIYIRRRSPALERGNGNQTCEFEIVFMDFLGPVAEIESYAVKFFPRGFASVTQDKDTSTEIQKPSVTLSREPLAHDSLADRVESFCLGEIAEVVGMSADEIDPEADWEDFGLDSVGVIELVTRVNQAFGLDVSPTVFFEQANLRGLVGWMLDHHRAQMAAKVGGVVENGDDPASASSETRLPEWVAKVIREEVGSLVGITPSEVLLDQEIEAFDLDSVAVIELVSRMNSRLEIEVSPTVVFDQKDLQGFCDYIVSEHRAELQHRLPGYGKIGEGSGQKSSIATSGGESGVRLEMPGENPTAAIEGDYPENAVAIIGMHGRFPQSPDLDAYWKNLVEGRCVVSEVPPSRWDWRAVDGNPNTEVNKTRARWGGFIDEVDRFDPRFFKISPQEAELMDPQHRLFLESVWLTVEDAGYRMSVLSEKERVGLFVGVSNCDYQEIVSRHAPDIRLHMGAGVANCMLPNRVSHKFDFRGPSVVVDTACSSSFVALHQAVESVLRGDSDVAIAGGVHLMLTPSVTIYFDKSGMLSPDGRCFTFDRRANGYVRGEGVASVLVKPLRRAIADGDAIRAVIRGTAVNHTGRTKSTGAPSPQSEADVIVAAMRRAKIGPTAVDYIEAHGTGTSLGDPIEIEGLRQAFQELSEVRNESELAPESCRIGSVKTNIGHLEPLAGMAGLFKVILAMKHGQLPASLQFEEANPYIQFAKSPFRVISKSEIWQPRGGVKSRVAGVSSFGFGGVNTHVVVQDPPATSPAVSVNSEAVWLVFSGKGEKGLRRVAETWRTWLRAKAPQAGISLADAAYTLAVGREGFDARLAIKASSWSEAADSLSQWIEQGVTNERIKMGLVPRTKRRQQTVPDTDGSPPSWELAIDGWLEGRTDLVEVAGSAGRRVPLPGYAFARDRYWIGEHAGAKENPSDGTEINQPGTQVLGADPDLERLLGLVANDALSPEEAASLLEPGKKNLKSFS